MPKQTGRARAWTSTQEMMPRQCGYQDEAHNPFCDMILGKNT
jgi:hypothetical protein